MTWLDMAMTLPFTVSDMTLTFQSKPGSGDGAPLLSGFSIHCRLSWHSNLLYSTVVYAWLA
jgi:hypothetical protein